MKKVFLLLLTLALFMLLNAQPLNIMTFNIRYNNPGDSMNAWPYRKDKAAAQILFHQAHIVGVQEALHDQMMDLQQQLKQYKYVGVGRDDGKQKGEYSAIFYDTARLQLLQTETFWLSEQPNVPGSKSWDAAITRIVTWARYRDKKTRKVFYAFNTHFDHLGKIARRESAKLLLQKIQAIAGNNPTIVTGDFNAIPSDEPIQVLTDNTNAFHLINTISISQQPHYGPTGTFNGFMRNELTNEPIDHIFVTNMTKGVKVLQHATLSESWQGRFSSDHFPVIASIVL
ncbi:MAG: endonuclease/exonuclease/phosphatase family protein [Flavisolibacter sp.]|nr:endonuclease/exonuclease/phosphatase family protein [Flavisolibacter sp.]